MARKDLRSVLTRDYLLSEYVAEKKSMGQLAKDTGCKRDTIKRYLVYYGIPVRGQKEAISAMIERGEGSFYGKMEDHPGWRGGIRKQNGYVYVFAPDHPGANCHGCVSEHRLVWEMHNGPLPDGWCVHHLNGIKDDNRIDNLEAMPKKRHDRYLPVLRGRIKELELEVSRLKILARAFDPFTDSEKERVTKKLHDKYGDYIKIELGPGRIAREHKRDHPTFGLNPSADYFCDEYFNLERGIPLLDESVDEYYSNQVIEHIHRDKIIFLVNEFWRTLKPGGTMKHIVPDEASKWAWADPTHHNILNEKSFLYFSQRNDGTPFVERFSDYGIECNFLTRIHVKPGVDITVEMEKPK